MIVLVLGLSTSTMGCLDEVSITGTVKTLPAAGTLFTYNYVVALVIGDAEVDKVTFKLEDKDDKNIIDKEKAGWAGLGGAGILFINNAGEVDMVDIGDVFSLIAITNCSGGNVKVYYDGNEVDKVKDLE